MPPVGAAIAAASSWFGGLSVFGQALVKIGASLLLSAASKALMPKPDMGMGGRAQTIRQPIMPRDLAYGYVRKGGTMIYMDVSGRDEEWLDMVIVVATHRVSAIGWIYFNGVAVIPPGSSASVAPYTGVAYADRRLGDANQTSFSQSHMWTSLPKPTLWGDNHRLRGCAAIWVRLKYHPDIYPSGIPNITCDVFGKNDIYDPRTGTTVYTDNPALCLADYMSNPVWGIGAAIGAEDGIDAASLIAAANICDEVVAKPGGGTERRYTCNGVVTLDQAPKTVIEAMLSSMAGTCGWQAGQWQIFAGAWRAPTITLTDDDIADGGFQLNTRVSQADNFNAVKGQFISPENDWQPDDFPSYESAVYLAEDGGERKYSDITLPFTISASMAQRLAKITLERQRRQMSVALTGKLMAWRAAVGDTVNLTYARWGFASKPFEVTGVGLEIASDGDGARLVPSLTLRETSSLVYDWTASEAKIYAAAPRTTLPSAFNVPAPGTPSVSEQLYQTFAGTGLKVMARITWQAAQSVFVDRYQVEARLGTGEWQLVGQTDQTSIDFLDIAPGLWEFRVKAINQAGVSSPWASASREIYSLGAAPSAITGLTLQTAGGTAILKWALHPDLDVQIGGQIVVRHSAAVSPSWSNSVSMDTVAGAQAIAVVPLKPGTYLLRAVDAAGTPGPVVTVATSGAQAIAFAGITTLTEHTAFSGAKSGVIASGGALTLDASAPIDSWADFDAIVNIDAEGGILPEGTYSFAAGMDFGLVKLVRLRSVIDLTITDMFGLIDTRHGDIDGWASWDGVDGSEVDVVVEARTTQTDPAGSPTWSGWGRVDSSEVQARGVQARAILKSLDASYAPSVTALQLVAEEAV